MSSINISRLRDVKVVFSNGRLHEALLDMTLRWQQMDLESYDHLLRECGNRKALREGQRVHSHMIKTRYLPPMYIQTRLLIMYSKCEALEDARSMLDGMSDRNVVAWTAMISAYSQKGYCSNALELFVAMLKTDVIPNEFTFATILASCTAPCGLNHGRQIHSLAIKRNFERHVFVGSSLLDMYAKGGKIHEAHEVFNNLSKRDIVSCTAIISGYAQLGHDQEALELFFQLQKEGMKANYVTYVGLLTALSGLAALDYGRQVHGQIIRTQELPCYVVLQNSLIDMYSKCCSLTYARNIFNKMSERTVITWNIILMGYAKHGFGKEVIKLFQVMLEERIKPDAVTLIAVLSGCSHGGLIDEGLKMYESMVRDDNIKLDTRHYGCVVDLLGRSGRINEAFNFIKYMNLEHDPAILGSLLGACRVHANVVIGEIVAKWLLDIESKNPGNYVILSNIYAAAGRWKDVLVVRELMKKKVVTKEPAWSWITVNHIIHTFHANDRVHPRINEILEKIREICIKLKESGYIPDLNCVLHDIDDEQKEKLLLGHSEKLALTFGLMESSNGTTIQIVKNLRICVDCHNFAKFTSKLYGRRLSVRDSQRFHHFVDGVCTCGDYW